MKSKLCIILLSLCSISIAQTGTPGPGAGGGTTCGGSSDIYKPNSCGSFNNNISFTLPSDFSVSLPGDINANGRYLRAESDCAAALMKKFNLPKPSCFSCPANSATPSCTLVTNKRNNDDDTRVDVHGDNGSGTWLEGPWLRNAFGSESPLARGYYTTHMITINSGASNGSIKFTCRIPKGAKIAIGFECSDCVEKSTAKNCSLVNSSDEIAATVLATPGFLALMPPNSTYADLIQATRAGELPVSLMTELGIQYPYLFNNSTEIHEPQF